MSSITERKATRKRRQGVISALNPQPRRSTHKDEHLFGILAHYRPGKADPLHVLEVILNHCNNRHTVFNKTVSYKTRKERANFLRLFYRDLREKAGFKTVPDPRNLGDRHIRAIVTVWQAQKLAPGTVQGYFSYLRGLASWLGKPGFIHKPDFYGMQPEEYKRSEVARIDKSWAGKGIVSKPLLQMICAFDCFVGAAMWLIRAFGLRRKEAIMFRPHRCVVPFEATGLDPLERQADYYVFIKVGAKGGRPRFIPLNSPERIDALEYAKRVVGEGGCFLADPRKSLVQNLRRFDYVIEKFGITARQLGVTIHGLRHEALIEHYQQQAGTPPPIRGGEPASPAIDVAARLSTAKLAGHNRPRASTAYLGGMIARREALLSRGSRTDLKNAQEGSSG